jgi:hypothetical protein
MPLRGLLMGNWMRTQFDLSQFVFIIRLTDGAATKFVSILSKYISHPKDKLSVLFHSMDIEAKGTIRWNELVNYTLHELTTAYSNEKLVWFFLFLFSFPGISLFSMFALRIIT